MMTTQVDSSEPAKQTTMAMCSAGLVMGSCFGVMYVLWALFVVSGGAQWLMDVISVMTSSARFMSTNRSIPSA